MGVRTNAQGGGRAKFTTQLYDALQYSGLVTSGMTHEEMCEILAETYPDGMIYDSGTWYKSYDNNSGYIRIANYGYNGSISWTINPASLYALATRYKYPYVIFSELLNLSAFNTLTVTCTDGTFSIDISNISSGYIYLENAIFGEGGTINVELNFGICSAKQYWATNSLIKKTVKSGSGSSSSFPTYAFQVTKIQLS